MFQIAGNSNFLESIFCVVSVVGVVRRHSDLEVEIHVQGNISVNL